MQVPKKLVIATLAGIVALAGLFAASAAGRGSLYVAGLGAFVGGVLTVLAMIKMHFDGAADERLNALFPREPRPAGALLVALGIVFLAGLFLASRAQDYYGLGLGLAIAALAAGFRTLHHLLAAIETHRGS